MSEIEWTSEMLSLVSNHKVRWEDGLFNELITKHVWPFFFLFR